MLTPVMLTACHDLACVTTVLDLLYKQNMNQFLPRGAHSLIGHMKYLENERVAIKAQWEV